MTEEEKIICKQFLNDADKTHSCNEYKLLMALLDQEPTPDDCENCIHNKGVLECDIYGCKYERGEGKWVNFQHKNKKILQEQ